MVSSFTYATSSAIEHPDIRDLSLTYAAVKPMNGPTYLKMEWIVAVI